jgi:hypothetical protein
MELRLFLARTVQRYHIEFARDYDVDSFEASIKDFFTMQMGPLEVVIKMRQNV